ncbi:MAG: 5-(carboxyamino)imidazole ribonucleotide synthase [Alphaproteobacteria bacterium]|nr:5-(carboxyamino)imidazole ribonucleotide synthase [Alphaproteobacteria bacterium]
MSERTLPPGATIGILGGGQLGRMTALAAASLGYRCHIYCQSADEPAAQVAAQKTVATFDDAKAIDRFAASVDVATLEFENVPITTLERIRGAAPVYPAPAVQAVAQNRLKEKTFANSLGIATAPFRAVTSADELRAAIAEIGTPSVLKTTRMGYDGKGQVSIKADTDPEVAWAESGSSLATEGGILEGFIDFSCEVSVIVARGTGGETSAFIPVENRHTNHILDETIAPANISAETANTANDIAIRLTEGLDVVGLLAIEMFVTSNGNVLVNEVAPRPHNSGHWTMDACRTSQFEQLVRAISGLPLGDPSRRCDAVMKNLIGNDVEDWPKHLADPAAKLHLYGKSETRPGRKMGHINFLGKPTNS